jgi:uncharacterized protein (TIGR04255 family)
VTERVRTEEGDLARPRHLSRAPLREALIDLQFETRLSMQAIDRFVESIEGRYGKSLALWETVFGVNNVGPNPETTSSHKAVGRRLEATNGPYVLQCREAGFTVSRLLPYGRWEELREEAKSLWSLLLGQVDAFTVSRIAVRYINEIKIPLPVLDFGDYLTCPPKVPDALPQAINGFLTRVVIPDEAANGVAIVTQALEGPPTGGVEGLSVTVILDIDVFRLNQIDARAEAIWASLDALRDLKNRMFFEHVTEKTVELYE